MFNDNLTEEEIIRNKRERKINAAIKREKVFAAIGDFFYNAGNVVKHVTRKKTPEEIELMKRENWLNNARRKEKLKAKVIGFFTKTQEEKEEEKLKKSEEFAKRFWEESKNLQKEKEKEEPVYDLENFDIDDFEDLVEKFDQEKEEDLTRIEENFKIKSEILKEENLETTHKNNIRNLKIAKVTLGALLTTSTSIVLVKHNLPVNFIEGLTYALSLNLGIYTAMNGIFTKEKECQKIKVFKNLSSIGE